MRPVFVLCAALVVSACGGSAAADGGSDAALTDAGSDLGIDAGSDAGVDLGPIYPDLGPPMALSFGAIGPLSGAAGVGSFRFGTATAATQIEDMNTHTDWWKWTAPAAMGGLGNGTFVGDAVGGYTHANDDVTLQSDMHLDAYRFSVEWARVEPMRDVIDMAALDHYSAELDALVAAGIRPMITVHHFSNPVWVDDPAVSIDCPLGPTDANLCGWSSVTGAPLIIAEIAAHAALLARTFGDRVDEWGTLNEPINYLLASYGIGMFPPGRNLLLSDYPAFLRVIRNFIAAHVAIYQAIKANDTIDADGDGVAASVGFTLSVAEWVPAYNHHPSTDPADVAATERVKAVYHYMFPNAVQTGMLDTDFDGIGDESHPEWADKLDWMGVQYYFRTGVTRTPIIPGVMAAACFGMFDFGSCLPPLEASHEIPAMGYEWYELGVYDVLTDFHARWPTLPLIVSEAGIATNVPARREIQLVRTLEQIARARADGVDVRGFYEWSLYDNFEWSNGFGPHFGMYRIDLPDTTRHPNPATTLYGTIARSRSLTLAQRTMLGGFGPLPPEM